MTTSNELIVTNLPSPRYVRGSTQDYDDWAALAEDQGWSHAEMINYMRKHQTLEPIDESITEVKYLPTLMAFSRN